MTMHNYMPGIWCEKCKSSSPPDDPCKCGRCADCGMPISADEAYVCDDCSAFYAIFRDPNGDMTGEDNG